MLPTRYVAGQSSALRKSRLEGRPSLLPKPRRPGSTDRLSTEARRPSTTGHRSSSAEPRTTIGGGRLSREASATNLPINKVRARSQQGERYGLTSMTPLRSTQMSIRSTTTPRTPSEEYRNWETSLEKALAFVCLKDLRPISTPAWQRAEYLRVQEALAARGGAGGGLALMRPLTIARFVEVVGALLAALAKDVKLNNDNYVAKLPHLSKRLLYPGTVSKSWLKTVNTLHAFPHALALISYFLDMANHVDMPVSPEWMYVGKDELSCLRREYVFMCWERFQEKGYQTDDLSEEYLCNLKALLGNDEEKIVQLMQEIKAYESALQDGEEAAARADEARRADRRDALAASARSLRAAVAECGAQIAQQAAARTDAAEMLRTLQLEVERASAENAQLTVELETQPLSQAERSRLLDDVDYANRVQDSKLALVEQTTKMLQSKEMELALWQKKSLSACVDFKQGLTHLAGQFPELATLVIDENELMSAECVSRMSRAVDELRECSRALAEQRAEHNRGRTALARKQAALLEETRKKITEMQAAVHREQQNLENVTSRDVRDVTAGAERLLGLQKRTRELQQQWKEYEKGDKELEYWEKQDEAWRAKLSAMREYISTQRAESQRLLEDARRKRVSFVVDKVKLFNKALQM